MGSIVLWFLGVMPLIVAMWWRRHGTDSAAVRASDDPERRPGGLGRHVARVVPDGHGVAGLPGARRDRDRGASLVYGLILLPVGAALLVWAIVGLARESRG